MRKKLTDKQLKFCEHYLAGGYNGADAYRKAYETDNDDVARTEASCMLKNPMIANKIKELEGNYHILGLKLGIDREWILKRIKDMLNATKKNSNGDEFPDWTAVNSAIVTWAKLTGEFEAEKKQITSDDGGSFDKDPSKMTKEEREEVKQKILKDL